MTRHDESGFALAGAVFALVVIAVLVTGAFFVARQESNIGKNSATYERAFQAAEAGLGAAVANWQQRMDQYNIMTVGDSTSVSGTLPSNGGSYAGYIRRLSTELFLIRVTGTDPTGSSSRTLASMTRLQYIDMDFRAGLTTRGSLRVGGASFIDGRDATVSGWGCPTTGLDTMPGVLTRDSTSITTSGCNNYNCIAGDPKIEQDGTINDSTFFQYGDLDWDALTAMATKIYNGNTGPLNGVAPIGSSTTCTTSTTSSNDNWGEPSRPATVAGCVNYFPIIYVSGNLKVTGGRGQGILLVEGDLSVQGGFEFYGPVIVRGKLETQGTGGHFNGGVMAANVDLESSEVLGNALITYSSCAITRALSMNSPGRLIGSRGWMEIVQ
jgi:hypothetical protein